MKRLFRIFAFAWLWIMIAGNLMAQENATYSRYTNLPTIYIETFNKAGITSKTTYVYATMWYVDENDQVTRYDSMQIRGRGNSTWNLQKKPYRIKFQNNGVCYWDKLYNKCVEDGQTKIPCPCGALG